MKLEEKVKDSNTKLVLTIQLYALFFFAFYNYINFFSKYIFRVFCYLCFRPMFS